jgi:hypothetical protein
MKSVLIIAIVVIVGVSGFMIFNNVIEFNQENLEKSILQIPESLKDVGEPVKDNTNISNENTSEKTIDISKIDASNIDSNQPVLDKYKHLLSISSGPPEAFFDSNPSYIVAASPSAIYDYDDNILHMHLWLIAVGKDGGPAVPVQSDGVMKYEIYCNTRNDVTDLELAYEGVISFNDDDFKARDVYEAGAPPPIGYILEINHELSSFLSDSCYLLGDIKLNDGRWSMVGSKPIP